MNVITPYTGTSHALLFKRYRLRIKRLDPSLSKIFKLNMLVTTEE